MYGGRGVVGIPEKAFSGWGKVHWAEEASGGRKVEADEKHRHHRP